MPSGVPAGSGPWALEAVVTAAGPAVARLLGVTGNEILPCSVAWPSHFPPSGFLSSVPEAPCLLYQVGQAPEYQLSHKATEEKPHIGYSLKNILQATKESSQFKRANFLGMVAYLILALRRQRKADLCEF